MAKLSRDDIDALLGGTPTGEARIGVLSTADAAGTPEGSPVWFEYTDGIVRVLVHRDSRKARNLRINPKVCLTVDTRSAPYRGVILRGVARVGGPDPELRKRLAYRYLGAQTGEAYLQATAALDQEDALLTVEVASTYSWDYSKGV